MDEKFITRDHILQCQLALHLIKAFFLKILVDNSFRRGNHTLLLKAYYTSMLKECREHTLNLTRVPFWLCYKPL